MHPANRARLETSPDQRLLLTVEEAADLLGIGRTLAYALVREGELPSLVVGRLRRVPAAALHDWIEQRVGGTAQAG